MGLLSDEARLAQGVLVAVELAQSAVRDLLQHLADRQAFREVHQHLPQAELGTCDAGRSGWSAADQSDPSQTLDLTRLC